MEMNGKEVEGSEREVKENGKEGGVSEEGGKELVYTLTPPAIYPGESKHGRDYISSTINRSDSSSGVSSGGSNGNHCRVKILLNDVEDDGSQTPSDHKDGISLLQRKVEERHPAASRKSRTDNLGIKVSVGVFFLIIMVGCSITWHFYHRSLLVLDIGHIKFEEKARVLVVEDETGDTVLQGRLGLHIPPHIVPFDCAKDSGGTNSLCLEYRGWATLTVHYNSSTPTRCYQVKWSNVMSTGAAPRDCLGLKGAHWYGGGSGERSTHWPIDTRQPLVPPTPHISSEMFGGVIERYWLSSHGVSISVDDDDALYVWRGDEAGREEEETVCFSTQVEEAAHATIYPAHASPDLHYTICVSEDMRRTQHHASRHFFPHPSRLPPAPSRLFMSEPSWILTQPNQSKAITLAQDIYKWGFGGGVITLGVGWEAALGDLTFNTHLFPQAEEMLADLSHNFTIGVQVHPYVSLQASVFTSAAYGGHLTPGEGERGPALGRWRGDLVGLLHLTRPHTLQWLASRLTHNLSTAHHISFISLVGGRMDERPSGPLAYFTNLTSSTNPDHYLTDLARLHNLTPRLIVSDVAHRTQGLPVAVRLTGFSFSWGYKGIRGVIPRVLSTGLLGYPFIHPGVIAGDVDEGHIEGDMEEKVGNSQDNVRTVQDKVGSEENKVGREENKVESVEDKVGRLDDKVGSLEDKVGREENKVESVEDKERSVGDKVGSVDDKELYIRWMELAAFLPYMEFRRGPWEFDEETVNLTRQYVRLHKDVVVPVLDQFSPVIMEAGGLLIRPIWWLDPSDLITHTISDQFVVGGRLLVAPVIWKGARSRDVYLPAGVWRDEVIPHGIIGSVVRGPTWLYDYPAPLDVVPHFTHLDEDVY